MTRIKFPISDSLALVPEGVPSIMLIRHGDRDQIPDGTYGNDYQLNDIGRNKSKKFGQTLLAGLNAKFFTSPIGRCVQTATYMLEGSGQRQKIEVSKVLGGPGPFVYDSSLGGQYFLEHGTIPTVMDMQDGAKIPGIRSISEGSRILDEMFNKCLVNNGVACNVLITHDAIIAPYINYHTGERFDDKRWIDFLDGAIIYSNDGKRMLIRNGQIFQFPGASR